MKASPDRPDAYGDAFAEVYDAWYGDVTDAEATAGFVAQRAGAGPVVELGVGTGRLAIPVAQRGLTVIGIDASAPMLDRCREAATAADCSGRGHQGSVLLARADMAALPLVGNATLALIGFNTLFNVTSQEGQWAVFAGLANCLADGGLVVVEALDLGVLSSPPGLSVGVREVTPTAVTVIGTSVDSTSQTIRGQHTSIDDNGIVVRPWTLRWATPAQIDAAAESAGMELVERYADWYGNPHGPDDDRHLSVYRRRATA